MNNSLVVKRDLDKARDYLQAATDHLGHLQYGQPSVAEIARAVVEVTAAVTAVGAAVERLAQLPACDHVS